MKGLPSLFALQCTGEKFVELVAEAVELATPTPVSGHNPGSLDPGMVHQAVHAVAASRRLHMLSSLKAGDSDPEAAEVWMLTFCPLLVMLCGRHQIV